MIQNLLFDLGGVIMDIRRENAVEALRGLGMENAGSFLGEYVQSGPFLDLESGKISAEEFRNEIRRYISGPVSDSEIDAAFTRFLVGIPEKRLQALTELNAKGYKLYMLSNTNPIMWNGEIASQFRKQGQDINYYFKGIVTSFEAGCCKPDPRIFELALRKFGIKAGETLFLDDSEKNTEAAARLGFNVATIKPGEEFISIFRK